MGAEGELATPPQGQSTGHQHLPEAPMDTAAAPGRGRGEGGYTLCHTNTDMAQGRCGLGETRGHRKRPGKSAHRYRLAHWKQCPYWEEQTPGKSRNGSLLPIHPGPHLYPQLSGRPGCTRQNQSQPGCQLFTNLQPLADTLKFTWAQGCLGRGQLGVAT